MLHSVDDDWLMPIASRKIVAPSELPHAVQSFAEILQGGKNAAVLVGNFAQQHPQAAAIHAAAQALGVKIGFLGEAANSVGGYLAGLPTKGNLKNVLEQRKLLLLNTEPELDCADPRAAQKALSEADFVVSLSCYKTGLEYADVLLPIAPFTETSGTFVSTEGRAQTFSATVHPLGEARPGWKVLRVLGSLLGQPGFDFDTVEQVRAACLNGRDVTTLLSNKLESTVMPNGAVSGIQRIADVPMYFADPLVRRAPSLQKTRDARPPKAWMNSRLLARLGMQPGQTVLVNGAVKLTSALDDKLPDECMRIAAAHPSTAEVGAMFGTLTAERAP
jgi:NADH-quinone oxidoreductase subunit G